MEMNIHARKFAVYSNADEQLAADDGNNNLKNVQITEFQQTTMRETSNKTNLQIDELRLRYQNSERKMEKHSSDTHSSDPIVSIETIETTKSNNAINFSVDSILSTSNWMRKIDTQHVDPKSASSYKLTAIDDCSRVYRPMPMRYVSNAPFFQGNACLQQIASTHSQNIQRKFKEYIDPLHQTHYFDRCKLFI